eukprot:604007-Prymnesium_polylepis.2
MTHAPPHSNTLRGETAARPRATTAPHRLRRISPHEAFHHCTRFTTHHQLAFDDLFTAICLFKPLSAGPHQVAMATRMIFNGVGGTISFFVLPKLTSSQARAPRAPRERSTPALPFTIDRAAPFPAFRVAHAFSLHTLHSLFLVQFPTFPSQAAVTFAMLALIAAATFTTAAWLHATPLRMASGRSQTEPTDGDDGDGGGAADGGVGGAAGEGVPEAVVEAASIMPKGLMPSDAPVVDEATTAEVGEARAAAAAGGAEVAVVGGDAADGPAAAVVEASTSTRGGVPAARDV